MASKVNAESNEKMDLVVVLLKTVQQKVIVPEHYINGYNQSYLKHLKNKGNNACRDHLIFWSKDIVEGEYYPNVDPNAKELAIFPPEKCGWYRGRTLWFTDDLQDAIKVRDRKRKVVPPVYNAARLSEQPLPLLVLTPGESNSDLCAEEDENEETDPLAASANISAIDQNDSNLWTVNISNVSTGFDALNVSPTNVTQTTDCNDSINNNNNDLASFVADDTSFSTDNDSIDISSVANASSVLNNSINILVASVSNTDNSVASETGTSNSLAAAVGEKQNDSTVHSAAACSGSYIKQEPEFASMSEEDCDAIGNIFNASFENVNDSDDDILIHRNDVIPPPIKEKVNPYKVKTNDIISGNIPFATNESGDRAYIVSKGEAFKQVNLTKRAIDGLMQYNSRGFRESPIYDSRFIKALLISLVGISKLADDEPNELIVEFIHDLFTIRSGKLVDAHQFKAMIANATQQIRVGKFH